MCFKIILKVKPALFGNNDDDAFDALLGAT